MNTQELRKLADACFPGLVATAFRECADKIDQLQAELTALEKQEPVAWGVPNSAITGPRHALMMVSLDVPSDDQYGGALWKPLYLSAGAK